MSNANKPTQPEPSTRQGRNSAMDKTDAYHPDSDPFANQGGGKLGGGNVNSGHPANNVITPGSPTPPAAAPVKGAKGSGMPTLSGAGQLADDRPGRNDPKNDHPPAPPSESLKP